MTFFVISSPSKFGKKHIKVLSRYAFGESLVYDYMTIYSRLKTCKTTLFCKY